MCLSASVSVQSSVLLLYYTILYNIINAQISCFRCSMCHDTADEQEYHVSDAATRPVWVPGPLYPIRFLAGWRKKRPEPGLVWFR